MSHNWHLAIESSGLGGSVALFHYNDQYQGELHNQSILPANQGSVRTLAPAIDQLLRDAQIRTHQLTSLSVTIGPGSFTGLRVGLTTSKVLGWSANIPIVPVDTLEAIAWRCVETHPGLGTSAMDHPARDVRWPLVTAINAFRRQVFTSSWLVTTSPVSSQPRVQCALSSRVVDLAEWINNPWQLEPREQVAGPLWISGGALSLAPDLSPTDYRLAPTELWQPLAEQVGQLGLKGLGEGRAVSAVQLQPNYIRSSAAEENLRKNRES